MNTADLTKLGFAAAILFGIYKFVPNQAAKAAVLGVAGVIAAKQIPYVKDVM